MGLRLATILFVLCLPAWAEAVSRFAAPASPALLLGGSPGTAVTGSGSTCSEALPCTVATALSQAVSGDHVVLKFGNGTMDNPMLYSGVSDTVDAISLNKSGVTVRPETGGEGKVLVDGRFARRPIALGANTSSWVIEGINARNGLNSTITVGGSGHVIRRVVSWDSSFCKNVHGIETTGSNLLFEDVGVFGGGRKLLSVQGSNGVTWRRVWASWGGHISNSPKFTTTMGYNSNNVRCENCLLTWNAESMPETYTLTTATCAQETNPGFGAGTHTNFEIVQAGPIFAEDNAAGGPNGACMNQRIFGSLAYVKSTQRWGIPYADTPLTIGNRQSALVMQGVSTNNPLHQCGEVRHSFAYISPTHPNFNITKGFDMGPGGGTASHTTSVHGSGVSDAWNAAWTRTPSDSAEGTSVAAAGATPTGSQVPSPWTSTTQGANLCFQWTPGGTTATTTPLWPWPMNDRILAATGYASSYGNGLADSVVGCGVTQGNCSGGRVARTPINVTSEIEAILGTIPSQCLTGGALTPVLSRSPSTLSFAGTVGQGNPPPQTVTITDTAASGTMTWTASEDVSSPDWLSISPTSGSGNGNTVASVDTTGLTADTYNGTITITAPGATGSPATVPVTLVMANPPIIPALAVSPTSLSYVTQLNTNPTSQSIAISDTNPGGSFTWTATDTASWLTVTPSSGSSDVVATVSIDVTGLTPNIYLATITVSAPGSTGTPQTVDVSLTVLAGTSPSHRRGGRIR